MKEGKVLKDGKMGVKATNGYKEEEKRLEKMERGEVKHRWGWLKKSGSSGGTEEVTERWSKEDKEGCGVGRETAQKEENASEKFRIPPEAILKQDRAGVSVYQENTEKDREKKEETERNPSLQSPPAKNSETRLRPQTSCWSPSSTPATASL